MQSINHSPLLEGWSRLLSERGDDIAVIDCASGTRHSFAAIEAMAIGIERELRAILDRQKTAKETCLPTEKSCPSTKEARPPTEAYLLPASRTATTAGGDKAAQAPIVLLSLPNGARWLAAYLAVHRCHAVIAPVEPDVGTRYEIPQCLRCAAARIDSDGITPLVAATPDVADSPATCTADRPATCTAFKPHLIKLTSGSTGQPQALRFSEANMIADGVNIIATMGLRADSLNYAAIPFGHSYGLGNLVLPFFLQGTAIVCASGILPNIVANEIDAHKVTFFPAVPTLIRALCAARVPRAKLASLERVVSAGSVLSPDLAMQFESLYAKRIHNFYGSSETGGICFDATGEATLSGQSLGKALANVRVDTDTQGQVRVQSAACTPDLADTHQRIVLADCATMLESGELRLEGRAGRMLKIGARRLDLSAWEAQARNLPGVEDAFVCAAARTNAEAALYAALQTPLSIRAVREQLGHVFPRWQQPARLLCLEAFPRTARGKIDTPALRALLESRKD